MGVVGAGRKDSASGRARRRVRRLFPKGGVREDKTHLTWESSSVLGLARDVKRSAPIARVKLLLSARESPTTLKTVTAIEYVQQLPPHERTLIPGVWAG